MASTYSKQFLSGSITGQQIKITATTSGSANQLHTCPAGTGSLDEIWLYTYNEATASVSASILWGSQIEPDAVNRVFLTPQSGRTLVVDGKLLSNGLTVYAYASVTNVIMFDGFVNRISS